MSFFRLAAIGDGLIGPLVHSSRNATGNDRSFVDNRFLNWLRVILLDAELAEDAVFGVPGETTVAVAKRVPAILDLDPAPDAVLICAGTEDCLATIKGVAPTAEQTVEALEVLATTLCAVGITPIFVAPPPCALFSNGLFADRFVAIAATLRRMHERDKRIGLVDATDLLMRPGSFGIEPRPCYVAAGSDGRLSNLGAFRLAQAAALQLQSMIPKKTLRRPLARCGIGALNANPGLAGSAGAIINEAAFGRCATRYCIDAHQLGGARVQAAKHKQRQRDVAQRLTFTGHYTTNWGFLRFSQNIDSDIVASLAAGDVIDSSCDFELAGAVENIAAVSLHTTPVWDNGFIGLHSGRYLGGPGVSEAHGGYLRTPQFIIPARMKKLHISLHVHLVPGTNLSVSGQLDIRAIAVRKVKRRTAAVGKVAGWKFNTALEARSGN